jgi:hypothetical protein
VGLEIIKSFHSVPSPATSNLFILEDTVIIPANTRTFNILSLSLSLSLSLYLYLYLYLYLPLVSWQLFWLTFHLRS